MYCWNASKLAEGLQEGPLIVSGTGQLAFAELKRVRVRKVLTRLIIAAAVFIPTALAFANGGIIERTAAGGITFIKSEDIRILEEVLEISRKEVRVKFRFLNESDHDIDATVAFPVPPREPTGGASTISATFKVLANGHPVPTQFFRRAVVGDRDVTAQLLKIGLSDKQIYGDSRLTKDQLAAVTKLDEGKAELLPYGFWPGWKVAETAFWQQSFPAGKETVIEHTYKPAVGRMPGCILYDTADLRNTTTIEIPTANEESGKDVCLDEVTRRAIEKQVKAYAESFPPPKGLVSVYANLKHIEYVLSTGRNWKGPIGDFKLRIKKEAPNQIVSLCFPGKPKLISPTVYEFVEKDFVPPDKLIVYFYMVGPVDVSDP
ncbi:MAG: DUF4424 family protein [Desulfomonilaceae bacterium]